MSEPETLGADVHPETTLLPWYVNGTLETQERQRVAAHLESCLECRRELDELMQIQRQLTEVYTRQPEPSPRLAQAVMAKVAQEASARRTATKENGHWLNAVDQWIRSLLLSQWAPTLAALVLVTQFGLLLWVLRPAIESNQVTTRSLSSPTASFKVTFQQQATEEQIRSLLTTVRGRIVDGPSSELAYVVQVIAGDPNVSSKTLETLRARPDIIRSADAISP